MQTEKLLDVHSDNKLKFDTHINKICQKVSRKPNTLARLTLYMDVTLFSMGLFGAAHGWGTKRSRLPKTCQTYPTMKELGAYNYTLPKEDQKRI